MPIMSPGEHLFMSSNTAPLAVTVAILTYRRPDDVVECLTSVLDQSAELLSPAKVIVVDNDPDGSAAAQTAEFDSSGVRYVHEPTPGIAAARNRALQEAHGSDVLVFIDDDERPNAGWLSSLVETYLHTRPSAVVGPVISTFSRLPDPWIVAGRFFERRQFATGTEVDVAATNNLLLDLRQIHALGLLFDDRFGLIGGSDNLFTRQLTSRGGRIVWCAEATVVDVVPLARLTRNWVLRRAYRLGNGTSLVALELADSTPKVLLTRGRQLALGFSRVAVGAARVSVGVLTGSLTQRACGARNCARGAGLITGAVGHAYAEYGRSGVPSASIT
jgi:hypothetical protein